MSQLAKTSSSVYERIARYLVYALLIGMPFHALVVIVLGNSVGYQSYFQAWKELLAMALLVCALAISMMRFEMTKRLITTPSNVVALIIIVLGLFLTLLNGVPLIPATFGIKVVLLPLVLYLAVQLAGVRINQTVLIKIVLWPSYAVAVLALLQEYIIPLSWWTALGYNSSTILPIQLVDPAVKSIRAFASLGGPNQLGAYLILPTVLGGVLAMKERNWRYALGSTLTLGGLVVSFSRSAWLGLAIALVSSVLLLGNKFFRIATIVAVGLSICILLVSSSMLPQYLQNTKLQYFLLHGRYNQSQQIEGSDVGRNSAQQKAITTIVSEPWGHGLGTAGPASFRAAQPLITESWYLQIGLELGVLGAGLFLIFFVTNGFVLARIASPLSLALAATLAGLTATNVFLHAWADSTLGIVLFILMGLLANERPSKDRS